MHTKPNANQMQKDIFSIFVSVADDENSDGNDGEGVTVDSL